MEDPVSPLALTKLRVPLVRPRTISRARLVDLLAPETGAGFVLVCAPAGYGKTTLLAEWAQSLTQTGTAVAWFSLDSADDDPIPFSAYLIASFIQALGPIPDLAQIAQLLRASPEIDLWRILPAVINAIALSGRECVLILDDYHLIASPAIHSALAYLLERRPENLRIAMGSRSDPPLPLARLRARGQILEIRTAGLRFTREESARFLSEVMRLDLSAQDAAALEERTEGWAAGLQLIALALAGRGNKEQLISTFSSSGHRYLVEYLMEEVFSHQPEEVQSFLLVTSILERMCGELCDPLMDEGRTTKDGFPSSFVLRPSSEILAHLDRSNLFLVPLDGEGQWYRYHHLFRDFLQARLKEAGAERAAALHRTACEWLANHAFLREAASHAFQTHDWAYAAAFVERHSFTLIVHSDISTIYEWCSAFPEEVMQQHAMLCILQSLALAYRFQRQNRARIEARMLQADRLVAAMKDRQMAQGLIDLTAVVRTFQAMAPDPAADPRELLAIARGMVDAYPEGDGGQFSGLLLTGYAYLALHEAQAAGRAFETARGIALREGLYFGIVESTFHLARLTHSQGQLRLAAELCRQGQADIADRLDQPEKQLPALGCLDIAQGCVLLEQDQLDEADERLCRGLELMGGGMNPYYLMIAHLALFRLYEIQGRTAEAIKTLDRLEAAWPDIVFLTRGLRVTHALRTTPEDAEVPAEAAAWCREFASSISEEMPPPGMGPFGAAEAYYLAYLTWARALIAAGQTRSVTASLARQLNLAEAHGLAHRVIELSLLEAQARRAEGDDQRAWSALERALAAERTAGCVRVFDQGPALVRLLDEAARGGIFPEAIERILAAIRTPEAPHLERDRSRAFPAQMPYGERLSERELEVLRLIAQGATNQEIAERLVITVGTVKSHINHVLGKLEAHNRTEAVARARGLGLLNL